MDSMAAAHSSRPAQLEGIGCRIQPVGARYIPRAVLASYDQGTMDLLGEVVSSEGFSAFGLESQRGRSYRCEAGMFNPTSLLASSSPGAFAACSRRCGTLVRWSGGGFSSGQAHGEFNDEAGLRQVPG